jgi:hypothetical protein
MTPASLANLREARELLADVDERLAQVGAQLEGGIPELAELVDELLDRDDGDGAYLPAPDLALLLLAAGWILLTVRQAQIRAALADVAALHPELN